MATITEAVPLYIPNPYIFQITRSVSGEELHRCVQFLIYQPDIYTITGNTIKYRLNQKIRVYRIT